MEKRYLPEDEETADKDHRFIKLSSQIIRGLLNIDDLNEEELEILDLGCKARRERAEREKAEKDKTSVIHDGPVVVPFDKNNVPDIWPPVAGGQVKTMSSMEIAEICEKRHDNVMRDIQATLTEDGKDALKFEGTYVDVQNKERPCYYLPRYECDLVVAGYSVKYRGTIIRRWYELGAETPEVSAPTFTLVVKDGARGVDLRELHQDLESKQEFSNWAKTKLRDFTQSVDYQPADEIVDRPQGGSYYKRGFVVSLECAKHIAMMENTERGKQVRQYFIECEKALKGLHSPTTTALPQTLGEALRFAADLADRKEALAMENTE